MTLESSSYATFGVFAGTFLLSYFVLKHFNGKPSSGGKKRPPSIGSVPIIGSIPFLPLPVNMHRFFKEKSKTLGTVISFNIGSTYVVVLNSCETLRDALVKHAADFSDRPVLNAQLVINPDYKGIVMRNYDNDFRHFHHLALSILKKFGFGQRLMEDRIRIEVDDLMTSFHAMDGKAVDPSAAVHDAVLAIISSIVFGKKLNASEQGDSKGAIFDISGEIKKLFQMYFGLFPLELCNSLRYIPPFRRKITEIQKVVKNMFDMIEQKIVENEGEDADENFISCYLKEEGKDLDRDQLAHTIQELIIAGSETSATTLLWIIVLLANHPSVQERAQRDIDEVVARDQPPSLEDQSKLPYVEAVILEIMRIRTLVPINAVHLTKCDTEVAGYFIPKGTAILPNLYAAHMDESLWGDPESFRPERFVSEAGDKVINKENMIAFSLGKRSCLGELLARQEIFLFTSRLLQQFHILPPEGQKCIEVTEVLTETLSPSAYNVRLVPRVSEQK